MQSDTSRALSEARIFLLKRSPFLGYLAMSLPFRFVQSLPAKAATDGVAVYLLEPDFTQSSISDRACILAHEILHVCLNHCPRRQARKLEIWNIAADIVANEVISKIDARMLIPGCVTRDTFSEYAHLFPSPDDITPELAYAILETILPKNMEVPEVMPDILPSGNASGFADEAEHRSMLMRAASYAASDAGTLPGWLQRSLEIVAPKMDWRSMLAYFVGTARQPERSFQRLSRRHLWRNAYMPGPESNTIRILAVIDVSGSIDEDMLHAFISEVQAISRLCQNVTLLFHDTEIRAVYDLSETTLLPSSVEGGGGTLFQPVIDYINAGDFDGAVWITDGQCFDDISLSNPGTPVLWLLSADDHRLPPWGWSFVLPP